MTETTQPTPRAIARVPVPAPAPAAVAEPGPVVSFTVNGFTITTSTTQAAAVVEQIAAALRKILGTGGVTAGC
ncbi:MAG: hypothetical protein JW839_21830 [Candidatus Lokiarchaeota archaeon]|nr:hypothetical protein [Candidatus Lokiarchaeota archaeon]